jgi:hypothetical protein
MKYCTALMNGKITVIGLEFSAGKWNIAFKKRKKTLWRTKIVYVFFSVPYTENSNSRV